MASEQHVVVLHDARRREGEASEGGEGPGMGSGEGGRGTW